MRKIVRLFFIFIIMLLFSFSINMLIISGEPVINNISPEDGIRLDSNPLLIVNVSNNNPMNIIWYFKETESTIWKEIGINLSVMSGVYTQEIPNGTKEGTNYQWRINISDINSSIEKTLNFRRRGWQIIFNESFLLYSPDCIRNLSVFNMDEHGNIKINFDMKFYNYTGPISMEIPSRLGYVTFYSNSEGIYSNIVIDLPKENQILFPSGYTNKIKLFRPDGLKLDNTEYSHSFIYDKWKVNVVGQEEYLNFEILYQTDVVKLAIFVIFLSIPIILNLRSLFNKRGQEFAIGSALIILPAISFPLLSEVPLLSYEMIIVFILSIIGFLISFSNWKYLKEVTKSIYVKNSKGKKPKV